MKSDTQFSLQFQDFVGKFSRILCESFHVTNEVDTAIAEIGLFRYSLRSQTLQILNIQLHVALFESFGFEILLQIFYLRRACGTK